MLVTNVGVWQHIGHQAALTVAISLTLPAPHCVMSQCFNLLRALALALRAPYHGRLYMEHCTVYTFCPDWSHVCTACSDAGL
jgi:hypothetical protein